MLFFTDRFSYEPMGTEEGPNKETRDGYESLKVLYSVPTVLPILIPETTN